MDISLITDKTVKNALACFRGNKSMAGNPLLDSAYVANRLRTESIIPSARSRSGELERLLADFIDGNLKRCRARGRLTPGRAESASPFPAERPGTPGRRRMVRADIVLDRALLKADFFADDLEREAWSTLYHYYLLPRRLTMEQIVAVAGISNSKMLQRRRNDGLKYLAELLVRQESDATAGGTSAMGPQRPAARHNLPFLLSRFIGRDHEVEELIQRVHAGRLVSILGPGGVGKTRLMLRAAEQIAQTEADFPDGVWLVELAGVADGARVPEAIAAVLVAAGLGAGVATGAVLEQVVAMLRDRSVLLILDNCEHLAAASASMVNGLLQSCPKLHLLLTSRFELDVPGESKMPVRTLPVPPSGADLSLVRLTDFAAVQLFVDRANMVQEHLYGAANAETIVAICQRLEGLPLAICLAAGRLGSLSLEDILTGLQDPFKLLREGPRTDREDHQALELSIALSWRLLEPAERQFFQHLTVFAGGFSLSAAQAVCSNAPLEGHRPDPTRDGVVARSLLKQLVAKSMVEFEHLADGTGRYVLLESLRDYGHRQLLDADLLQAMQERHARYYVELSVEASRALETAKQTEWLDHLEFQHDNLRAALAWTAEHARELNLRMVGSLMRYWHLRGHLTEGRNYARAAVGLTGESTPMKLKYEAGNTAAALAYYQGDFVEADHIFAECLENARQLDNPKTLAAALDNCGSAKRMLGDHRAARALHEQSLAILRASGDAHSLAITLVNAGLAAMEEADFATAQHYFEEGLDVSQDVEDEVISGTLEYVLGLSFLSQGQLVPAQPHLENSLTIRQELGDEVGVAEAMFGLGWAMRLLGDFDSARRYLGESIELSRKMQDSWGMIDTKCELAAVAIASKDFPAAASHLVDGRALVGGTGFENGLARLLNRSAELAYWSGAFADAETHYAESISIWRRTNDRSGLSEACWGYARLCLTQQNSQVGGSSLSEGIRLASETGNIPSLLEGLDVAIAYFGADSRAEVALRLAAAVDHARAALQLVRTPVSQPGLQAVVRAARDQLENVAHVDAWETGQRMGIEQAVDLALKSL